VIDLCDRFPQSGLPELLGTEKTAEKTTVVLDGFTPDDGKTGKRGGVYVKTGRGHGVGFHSAYSAI
jgi:hypothetical protein